jgi:hypothetical protein
MKEDGEGVTSSSSEPLPTSSGQMGIPILTERLTKMVTDVKDGPVASGDGRAVDKLNIQDLRDIRDAADKLKISKNPAVKAACSSLDDQEGRGWLGADLLGVTLVHSYEAPTEGHKVGQQIDDILSEAKVHCDRVKGAARKRKTDTRKKGLGAEELAAKLKAIDDKLARDLAEYARTLVDIKLPQGVTEVKRERPAPPAPPPSTTEDRLRAAVVRAEEAAASAGCDLAAARRTMERAQAVGEELSKERLAAAVGGWKLDDEAHAELTAHQAELAEVWDQQMALASELRKEYSEAILRDHDAKSAAEEARHDLAAHRAAIKREADFATRRAAIKREAELEAARAADAERAAAADEAAAAAAEAARAAVAVEMAGAGMAEASPSDDMSDVLDFEAEVALRREYFDEIYEEGLRAIERGERPVLPPHMKPSSAFLSAMDLCDKMERTETRRRVHSDAVRQWGPDHASRPPAAVYDMRG